MGIAERRYPMLAIEDEPGLSVRAMREALDDDFRLQVLKTRSSGGIYPDGVRHHFDTQTGSIVPMPSDLPTEQLEF